MVGSRWRREGEEGLDIALPACLPAYPCYYCPFAAAAARKHLQPLSSYYIIIDREMERNDRGLYSPKGNRQTQTDTPPSLSLSILYL